MYLVESQFLTTPETKASFKTDQMHTMFFPQSFLAKVDEADKYECWGTNFKDVGEDYTDHILIKNSRTIAEIRIPGY